MNKKYVYFLLIFTFFAFSVLIIKYRKDEIKFEIPVRQGALANSSEWINSKDAIRNLVSAVNSNPSDIRSKTALGIAYIQESRVSGNHSYNDKAALTLFNDVLKKDPVNFEALIGKATVLLSQHHFTDAIPVAENALKISPYSSSVYGLFTDAYVETGEYKKAVEMVDKMTEMRPDARSYSRISYLREIYGNYPGAIEAMKMAVEAGYPGESKPNGAVTSWDIYMKIPEEQMKHYYVITIVFITDLLSQWRIPVCRESVNREESIKRL